MYKRKHFDIIKQRLNEPRKFIQVVMGPRQVGKSTVVKQVLKEVSVPYLFNSADNVPASNKSWIADSWMTARTLLATSDAQSVVLVIDEIQKIKNWSEVVKKEWDDDTFNDRNIKVILLGSSRVMIERGLSESLTGRFETIKMGHWSYSEMHECFGVSIEQYMFFGGFPGAAVLLQDEDRYRQYINDSIIDATINKDILIDTPIGKPALMRQTFELAASYSGCMLSLTKMVGALQDVGNTTTIASYLKLLADSGLVCGLQKYSVDMARRKASIPKFQVYDNALLSVYCQKSFAQAILDRKLWGHIYESAVGAYIVSRAFEHNFKVYYWRDGNDEVDFVLQKNNKIVALEVKSNNETQTTGLTVFCQKYQPAQAFIVGNGGIPLEHFFNMDLSQLFK